VPTPLQVDEFVAVCSEYLERNPDSYIGARGGPLSPAMALGHVFADDTMERTVASGD